MSVQIPAPVRDAIIDMHALCSAFRGSRQIGDAHRDAWAKMQERLSRLEEALDIFLLGRAPLFVRRVLVGEEIGAADWRKVEGDDHTLVMAEEHWRVATDLTPQFFRPCEMHDAGEVPCVAVFESGKLLLKLL